MTGYWAKVAKMVGTRSAAECHHQHTSQGTSQTPAKKAKKPRKEKMEAAKDPGRERCLSVDGGDITAEMHYNSAQFNYQDRTQGEII